MWDGLKAKLDLKRCRIYIETKLNWTKVKNYKYVIVEKRGQQIRSRKLWATRSLSWTRTIKTMDIDWYFIIKTWSPWNVVNPFKGQCLWLVIFQNTEIHSKQSSSRKKMKKSLSSSLSSLTDAVSESASQVCFLPEKTVALTHSVDFSLPSSVENFVQIHSEEIYFS